MSNMESTGEFGAHVVDHDMKYAIKKEKMLLFKWKPMKMMKD